MNRAVTLRVGIQIGHHVVCMPFIKKLFFYWFNNRGAHLLTVDIWEQPLSVGP